MKKRDLILIIVLLLVAGGIYISYRQFISKDETGEGIVVVTVEGNEYGRYPLNVDAVIEISGKFGYNTLEIKDGKARIIEADCPDQICVNHMPIHHSKDLIICLPNEVIVEIIGTKTSGVDATAQ